MTTIFTTQKTSSLRTHVLGLVAAGFVGLATVGAITPAWADEPKPRWQEDVEFWKAKEAEEKAKLAAENTERAREQAIEAERHPQPEPQPDRGRPLKAE